MSTQRPRKFAAFPFASALLGLVAGTVGCGELGFGTPTDGAAAFTSDSAAGVKATITTGTVVGPEIASDAPDFESKVREIVQSQLRYSVGFFNGREGAPSLGRTLVRDLKKLPDGVGAGLAKYSYSAELTLALGKDQGEFPSSIELILPAQVDAPFLQTFLEKYKADCVMGLNLSPTVENYWYYYRPEAFFCPLRPATEGAPAKAGMAVRIPAQLVVDLPGPVTYPEYDKLWSDGRLTYTGVFMRVDSVFGDIGEESMASTARDMIAAYGEPTIRVPERLTVKELKNRIRQNRLDANEVVFEFATPRGALDVNLFLIKSLDKPSEFIPDFEAKYTALTRKNGVFVFNGHASYGRDVERFSALGSFAAGNYHLFVLNACDSFAYEAPRLREAHRTANLGNANPDSYFDLVTNAMPAPAFDMPAINLAFLGAAVEAKRSYLEILAGVDGGVAPARSQRAVVLYDEDNKWTPTAEKRTVSESGTLAMSGEWKEFGPYRVAAGTSLTVSMTGGGTGGGTGTGDVDLYARRGAAPTTALYDCRPWQSGSTEACTVADGPVYIAVRSAKPRSSFALSVTFSEAP